MELGTEAIKQQEKAKKNNYSGDVDTTRLMMIKDNGIWYPGVLVNRNQDPGDTAGTIEVRYGDPDFFLKFGRLVQGPLYTSEESAVQNGR